MRVPDSIAYLLSLRRSSGGLLVYQGGNQTIINLFPPNTSIVLTFSLLGNDYMYIVYGFYLDPSVVPNAFYGWASYFGNKVYEGQLNTAFMTYEIESLAFVSAAEPGQFEIRNVSPLVQYYAGFVYFVAIASKEDFDTVLAALKDVGTVETNRLLKQLVEASGVT